MRLRAGEHSEEVRLEKDRARVGDHEMPFTLEQDGDGLAAIVSSSGRVRVRVRRDGRRVTVWCAGRVFTFESADGAPRRREEAAHEMVAPMPGRIRRVVVAPGGTVAKGDVVLVLEAMKMEHAIRAPREGIVRLSRAEGDLVEAGERLADVEAPLASPPATGADSAT
jgi:acetyl/propionyl-CoA carboxylase alpha subunit